MREYGVRSGHTAQTLGRMNLMIFGYLDAGSGSLILQAILGGAAGIFVAFKAWKARLMSKGAVAEAQTDVDAQANPTDS